MSTVIMLSAVLAMTSALACVSYRVRSLQSNVFVLLSSWILFSLMFLTAWFCGGMEQLHAVVDFVSQVDFYTLVVDGMLCYLLFIGCLHVDVSSFWEKIHIIMTLAFGTTLLSFIVTGTLLNTVFWCLGMDYPMVTALLYAAIIAPTDPVAVLALLKNLNLSKELYTKVASESLLNDGVGVVLFVSVLKFADVSTLNHHVLLEMVQFLLYEGVGALCLGVVSAHIVFRALMIKRTEPVMVSELVFLLLCLINLVFLIAKLISMSPPLAAVGAGLYASYRMQAQPISLKTTVYGFWEVIDELLNYVLFFIVGFQAIFIDVRTELMWLMVIAVALNFIVRVLSVCVPLLMIRVGLKENSTLYRVLVIGGLKGGLSLALVLAVPKSFPGHEALFDMTYAVVAFTIVIQGLSIERYLKLIRAKKSTDVVAI